MSSRIITWGTYRTPRTGSGTWLTRWSRSSVCARERRVVGGRAGLSSRATSLLLLRLNLYHRGGAVSKFASRARL